MSRRFWLWGITIILLVISLPGLFFRWDIEMNNDTYELAVPYQGIYDLTTEDEDTLSTDEALTTLKSAGLNTVSISPISLQDLHKRDVLTIYGQKELENILQFSHQELDFKQAKKGFYLTLPEDPYYLELINMHFDPVEIAVNDQVLYFIPTNKDSKDRYSNLGYDQEVIKQVKQHGLHYIIRIENDIDEDINLQTVEELIQLKDDPRLSTLLFSGEDVIGYPDPPAIKSSVQQLDDAGFSFSAIEFSDQKGMQTVARATNYNTIRLHSLDLRNNTDNENVERAIRAVKERNIRTVFFHVLPGDPEESLENATEFIEAVQKNMPNQYKSGIPTAFEQINPPLWSVISALLAGILFTYLASEIVRNRKLSIASIIFMSLLIVGYFLLQKLIFLQAFALVIAIITPIYAIIATAYNQNNSTRISSITMNYIKAIGISLIGLIIMLGVLNGNGFISGFELFRGVKLVYIVPLVFVTLFVMWNRNTKLSNLNIVIDFAKSPVKYWHIAVIGFIGAISFYYITRTGNAGSVSELELVIRQKLEALFYVRPRTKEFLIGLPLYMVALYTMGNSTLKKWGKFLLIPGIIGFLSIMNTFSHMHIPLNVSLLRTGYGIVLGYLFGLLFIYLFVLCYRYISKAFKKRWI